MLGAGGLWACLYCIRDGQYDDLDTPSVRVLLEDRRVDEVSSEDGDASFDTDPPSGQS